MSNVTQKDLLLSIKEGQDKMAQTHLDFSLNMSKFIKDQEQINTKVLGYLENDNKTNTKGVVELSNENKRRLDENDTKDRVRIGMVSAISLIFGFLGSILIKVFVK